MTILEWSPNTCPCLIQYDPATDTFVKSVRRCNEHRLVDGQPLLDAIQAHVRSFSRQFAVDITAPKEDYIAESTRISELERAEKERIESEGPTETR